MAGVGWSYVSQKKSFHCNAVVIIRFFFFFLAVYDYKTIRVKSRGVRDPERIRTRIKITRALRIFKNENFLKKKHPVLSYTERSSDTIVILNTFSREIIRKRESRVKRKTPMRAASIQYSLYLYFIE